MKVLVISQNKGKGDQAEELFKSHDLHIKAVYPGSTKFPRTFDAVCVFHYEANEINFLKDLMARYVEVPIKICFGKVAYPQASQWSGAQAFTHD